MEKRDRHMVVENAMSKQDGLRAIPVQVGERLQFIDILRGLAILGILVENMAIYGGRSYDLQALSRPVERVVALLVQFLLEAKSYSLLAFLFGWGVAMQMARSEERGAKLAPLYLRRLAVLLVLGLLHGTLIWFGDILTLYAFLGVLLLLFHNRSEKAILVATVGALLFRIMLNAPGEVMAALRTWIERATDFLRYHTYPESLYASGTYAQITRRRVQDYLAANSRIVYSFGSVFGMMLLGLYLGRRKLFREVRHRLPVLHRMMWVGLIVGGLFNGAYAWSNLQPGRVPAEYYRLVRVGLRTVGAPALALSYVAAVILLVRKETWHRRLAPLANVGRMSLSNYLLQSVLCTTLYYSYGLGLYGEVGVVSGAMLAIVIYVIQVRVSEWWFDSYQFGPVEWLWRSLTYGRRQPLRLGETYQDVRSVPWLRSRRGALASVLVVSGLVLLVAGALFSRYARSEQTPLELPLVGPKAIATSAVARVDRPRDTQPETVTVIATPEVRTLVREPGPIAASGDLMALAFTFGAESAMAQIGVLTGPPYQGRYAGSAGGRAAGDYIAEQFAMYGLQPAGEDGTFFQSFPVEYVALADVPSLVVEGADGGVCDRYVPYQDFSPILRWYAGSGMANGQVVWASECAREDYDSLKAVGKVVLCRGGSVQWAQRQALEHGAAGLLLLADPERRPPDFGNTYFDAWVPEPLPTFRVYPSLVEDLLQGSGKSVEDLSSSFTSLPLFTHVRMQVTSTGREACPSNECRGRNVLGVILGRDPEYADQVVILGAHYDHLGQSPDGTTWVGANDDASGVAVMLEIARTWQEQGYVPRRTVVFAAWDAEEQGLLGAKYYVMHPRYPLEKTVAKIQLDMVGAGGDVLHVDGGGELGEKVRSVAEALGVEAEGTNSGRSDHVPFLEAGVPASLMIWSFGEDSVPSYHRPMDTTEIIELDKLEAVGRIAGISILALTEGEPAISELLVRRAAAAERGDLDAFLATSIPDQHAADRFWLSDLQALSGMHLEMRASDVRVLGREAIATVRVTLEDVADGGQAKVVDTSLSARFVHDGERWRWAGPNLTRVDRYSETSFAVAGPPGREKSLQGIGQRAAERYAEIAALLGLPIQAEAALLVFPSSEALRTSTALTLSPGEEEWIDPGVVRLVHSPEISTSVRLTDALVQLALAEAGVVEAAAPWLWQGLPLALRAHTGEQAPSYLPELRQALDAEAVPLSAATAWAAVDYLKRGIGWDGVGRFIADLGRACREGLCDSVDGIDGALLRAIEMDSSTFETAWQADWQRQLVAIQAGLDATLMTRMQAALAGDEAAFLSTVDKDVPGLIAEERGWLANLATHPLESFALTGTPVVLFPDNSVLAEVTLEYRLSKGTGRWSRGKVPLSVLFTPSDEGYRWAGSPFEMLRGDRVSVLYPKGQGELAGTTLTQAGVIYAQIAAELGIEWRDPLVIKLYESDEAFRSSISPSFPLVEWVPGWTEKGGSIKLRLRRNATSDEYRSMLAVQVARHLLCQMGVDSEWLIQGASVHLVREFDGGLGERAAASGLGGVLQAVSEETLHDLDAIPSDYELSEEELRIVKIQAWDTVRYLTYTYGQEALLTLLQSQGKGHNVDTALRDAIGQSLHQFQAAWSESIARAHALPEWIEIAQTFDLGAAEWHVQRLASPEFAGRQAGSSGAEEAAAYIAARFAQYGLMPVGAPTSSESEGDTTFLQRFPISYTTLLATPRLEVTDTQAGTVERFGYRADFVTLAGEIGSGGSAAGDLIWIEDADYQGMKLGGKIVVRRPLSSVGAEAARAAEHGAGGLVLVGKKADQRSALAKASLPAVHLSDPAIPVLELTQKGYLHLLEMAGYTRAGIPDAPPALALGLSARIEIPLSAPETVETANVLGLLAGWDPALRHEVIILGAHYDHVGDDPDRRYAGANDNASGVAVLLEIARLWHEAGYRPRRSVLFAAWGAQEPGEIGSSYYAENPVFPLEDTVATVQLHAVGGGDGYFLEAQGDRERDGLVRFSIQMAEEWVDGRLTLTRPSRQSDDVPFRRAGIPTLLLTWREASEENWPIEVDDQVQPYRLGVTGRMVTLALMSLAR